MNHHITLKGIFGVILTFSSPWFDFLGLMGQIIAGIGGLILLFLSIKHKIMEIENERKVKEHLHNKDYKHDKI